MVDIVMSHTPHSLSLAVHLAILACASVSVPAFAAPDLAEADAATTLDAVHVVAIGEDPNKIAHPYSVVSSDELLARSGTLGEAIDNLPGVHADTFGGGASRPVIRGQTAPRVKVLSDSNAILDASDISPDHATTVDPLLGERIEILRGPATLLYGGGAIGGVVNVLDNKIPTEIPENTISGRLLARGNTVANEQAYAGAISAHLGNGFVAHAEGSYRDADDYRAPKLAERRVDGTFSESKNGSLGLSWVSDRGYIGLAYSYRDDGYGLPGHNHEFEGCHPHGSVLDCGGHDHGGGDDHEDDHDSDGGHDHDHDHDNDAGHDHDHDHEHGAAPVVDLVSRRFDLRGEYSDPFPGFSRIRFRSAYTDYRHHEIEAGAIATTFKNEGHESRVELQHIPVGVMTGVLGLQYGKNKFEATGEEAFLPRVDTTSMGLFAVEHFDLNEAWHLEAGARHDWLKHQPVNDERNRPKFDSTATSFSGAVIWAFQPGYSLTFSAARSQRLPHAQELYARGVHIATNTYECGLLRSVLTCGDADSDAKLRRESSQNVDLRLAKTQGDLTFSFGVFANNIDNYIYARTLDQEESDEGAIFRLIKYSQKDARFRGFEAEVTYQVNDFVSLTAFGDRVNAHFDQGGYLPRIPAGRYGARFNVNAGAFDGELEYYHADRQDRFDAEFEKASPSYNMLNMTLNYRLPDNRTQVFVRGANLFDKQVWNHASFLASVVPLPGRNITFGVNYNF